MASVVLSPSLPLQKPWRKGFTWERSKNSRTLRASLADGAALLKAAKYTVDTYIRSGMVVGLGSGRASGLAIEYLGRQLKEGTLNDIVGIPMSVFSGSEAVKAGIPLDQYQESSQIDFAFNDADIMEWGTLITIIGRRKWQDGESIIQEKSIVQGAGTLAFIVTERQYTGHIDGSVPVLVHTYNWMQTAEEIEDLFLGDAEVWRRPALGHADPLGGDFPLITRDGHNVLDLIFTSSMLNPADVAERLDKIDGVVDHGIVSGMPCTAIIASEYGLRIVDNLPKKTGRGL